MIVTHRPRVPFHWLVAMTLPWAMVVLLSNVNDQAITYTIRKFVIDPRWIAALTSLNFMSNVVVGAPCAFVSDRYWTRWGRRRPWLIASLLTSAALLVFVPLAPSLLLLVPLLIVLQAAIDLSTPLEALYFEVVPQAQRGRAVALRTIAMTLTGLFFTAVLFAQFDRRYSLSACVHLTGEQVLYAATAALLLGTALFLAYGVRETALAPAALSSRSGLRAFFVEVFGDARWYPVYLLYIIPTLLQAGAGPFLPLLITERFGYSKPQMVAVTLPVMLLAAALVMPVIGWLADRVARTRLVLAGMLGQLLYVAVYWWYVSFAAPGGIPALATILGFGLVGAVCNAAVAVTFGALLFDFVPSNRMGTLSAGFGLLANGLRITLVNVCGVFITWYPHIRPAAAATGRGTHDYAAVLVAQLVFGAGALGLFLLFLWLRRRGYVTEYARIEQQAEAAAATGTPQPIALPT